MHHVCQQTCYFRRSTYEKLGGLDLKLHCVMDTELWCRMWAAGTVWGHLPAYLGAFRQHGEAKGSAAKWLEKYRREEQGLREQFPQFCGATAAHQVGIATYRALQILSGRQLGAMRDVKRYRGRSLDEVGAELTGTTLRSPPSLVKDHARTP